MSHLHPVSVPSSSLVPILVDQNRPSPVTQTSNQNPKISIEQYRLCSAQYHLCDEDQGRNREASHRIPHPTEESNHYR